MSVLVASVGNPHAGDDGAGPAVASRLRDRGLPEGFRVEELHTDVLALAAAWRGEPEVWIVDAFTRGAAPGTVHRLGHEELLALPQRHAHVHALSLPENLRWLLLARPELAAVRFFLWGIEPAVLTAGERLSPPVAAAVEAVAREILDLARARSPRAAGSAPGPC